MINPEIYINLPYSLWEKYAEEIRTRPTNLEIFFDSEDLDKGDFRFVPEIADLMGKGRKITYHAPYEDMNPGSKDEKIRDVFFQRMQQLLNLAKEIPPKIIVVHPGLNDLGLEDTPDRWIQRSAESWSEVMEISEGSGILFALENIYERKPDRLVDLMERVNHRRFKSCFDIGHFNVCSQTPLDIWLDRLGPYLVELHIHNNYGLSDDHLGMTTGTVDFPSLFGELQRRELKPVITLEPHSLQGVKDSVMFLTRFFRQSPV